MATDPLRNGQSGTARNFRNSRLAVAPRIALPHTRRGRGRPATRGMTTNSSALAHAIAVAFRSNDSWVHVKLHNVAHVQLLSYNVVSLTSLAQEGHTSVVEENGATLKLNRGRTVQFHLIGKLCRQYGYRPEATGRMVDTACAVIAPGRAKAQTPPTNINFFHWIHGHTHEALLKQTAKQQGVSLSGELHEYRGYSMAKGLRKPIARSTDTRAGLFCPSRAPAALALHCQRGGVYSRRGRERGGRVKSRRKEGNILGQRV